MRYRFSGDFSLNQPSPATAVLASGGLDSSILLVQLAKQGAAIPVYVRLGHAWEAAELHGLRQFIAAARRREPQLQIGDIQQLHMPVADVYGDHWSIAGGPAPAAGTPDDAVFLPGRNMLLCTKAALWCQLNGIRQLALGVLSGNPFEDSSSEFFNHMQNMLNAAGLPEIRIDQPLQGYTKNRLLETGAGLPLELTFSCLSPAGGLHCGVCNKCDERRNAFRCLGFDATCYANSAAPSHTGASH